MLPTRRYQFSSRIQKQLKGPRVKPKKLKFHPINASLVEDMFRLSLKYLPNNLNPHLTQWLLQLQRQWPEEYEKGAKRSSWAKGYLTRLHWVFKEARPYLKVEGEITDMDKVLLSLAERIASCERKIKAINEWKKEQQSGWK